MLVNLSKIFQLARVHFSEKMIKIFLLENGWVIKAMVILVGALVSHLLEKQIKNIHLESINWLEYMQTSEHLRKTNSTDFYQIQHFFRGGEKRFIDFESITYVDGYAENDDGTETWIFEFLGCHYHYCEHCETNLNKRTNDEERERYVFSNYLIVKCYI